ncbi:MAG: hypothetical protein WDN23_09365 [Edaphobacter sp.]
MPRTRLPYLLIPLAAFIAILPLLTNGCSCGHDFDFHFLSWLEAARQFTHGNLHPHWAYTPAYNAGEPRFVFYPPLSWTIGAILGLILPWTWTPIAYTWLVLTAAGISLYHLAREFTPTTSATIAAVLYTVNPYMLFTAYERTAYAELLASAFIPLLLQAILRPRITIARIAIPIALLWLTNAPAAVMSCYALALLTLIRIIHSAKNPPSHTNPFTKAVISTEGTRSLIASPAVEKPASPPLNSNSQTPLQLALKTITGTALGLGLAAFYIIPAAYERRFVQIAMAIIPFYRIQDNFLFHQTADAPHDQVLHTASVIAVILIAATTITLVITRRNENARVPHPSQSHREGWEVKVSPLLLALTIAITLLQTPLTKFIWTHAPELAFLQFPWRLLVILAAVFGLTIALAITPLKLKPATTAIVTLIIAAAITYPAYKIFHQPCDPADTVQARVALFHSNQGTDPTDEYTPTTPDNDFLAHTNPPYWLALNPNAPAPTNTQPGPAPAHLSIKATQPGFLILNLRDYPSWDVTTVDPNSMELHRPEHIRRDDGLIALRLYYAADYTLNITYIHSLDQILGDILSLASFALLLILIRTRIRKSATQSSALNP